MRRLALGCALVACGLAAPSADAAVTLGQVFTPTAQTTATVAQTAVTSGVGYTVPSDGVITSWTFQADPEGATVRLKVVRANPDGTHTLVGQSAVETVAPNQLGSFRTRVPVKAGDFIGTAGISGKTVAYTGADGDRVVLAAGDQEPGSTTNYSNVQGIRVDVTASLEPDADADGYGDESEDLCTTDPTLQTPCTSDLRTTVRTDRPRVSPGSELTFSVTVENLGPSRSENVTLRAELSPEIQMTSATGAPCQGGASLSCDLGTLANGQVATVTVTGRATGTGVAAVAARAAGGTDDSNLANNSAGGSSVVAWRPGRCANATSGSAGRDALRGTSAGDLLQGLGGDDVLLGLAGADCLLGGDGNDRLIAGSGGDRVDGGAGDDRVSPGSGRDRVSGGSGADRIDVVDGARDTVDCGPGRDRVRADAGDRLRRCERVQRVRRP